MAKELSAVQISGFLNQLYLKSNWVNQCDVLYAWIDLRKIKADMNVFSRVLSKMLSVNKIA